MANPPYLHGTVTVSSTATLVCSPAASSGGVVIQNGATAIFLGGPGVTSSGATQGVSVAANATLVVPTVGYAPHDLWAITASGSSSVSFLFPS